MINIINIDFTYISFSVILTMFGKTKKEVRLLFQAGRIKEESENGECNCWRKLG